MRKKLIALIMAAAFCLTACSDTEDKIDGPEETPDVKDRIVIGTSGMTGSFSPFFTENAGDFDVMSVINAPLVTLDRRGEVVLNAAKGETKPFEGADYAYSGISDIAVSYDEEDDQTVLNFKLRNDVFFSDGEKMDADDLVFTLYALCDADYRGGFSLSALPIKGLDFYGTNTDAETFAKYKEVADACLRAGIDFSGTSEDFTQEQYDEFYACYRQAWLSHVREIVAYCVRNYAGYAHLITETGDVFADEWVQVALAMMVWRIADFVILSPATEEEDAEYGNFTSFVSEREWNLTTQFPTVENLYREFYELYSGDLEAYISAERIGENDDPLREAVRLFIEKSGAEDEGNTPAASIEGIRRVNAYEVEVTLEGQIPSAIYSFVIPVAPLHHYGNASLYNYDGGSFGFSRGDLSVIRAKNGEPLGAGPYRLVEYNGLTAELEANEHYFKGEPETLKICFRETNPYDLIYGVAAGTHDIAAVQAAREVFNEIDAYITGGTGIFMEEASFGACGYIGMNAHRVNVGISQSDESISFRMGFAVLFAAYREITVRDFYEGAASVVQYPVSSVSRAAPRQTDSGYTIAYTTDAEGNAIYTAGMNDSQRLNAAKKAALGYFEAAGCELNEDGTAIEEFPEDVSDSYEIYITGGGTGRHPGYLLLTMAAETLDTMGISLIINDVESQGEMYKAVIGGDADMWCGAWLGENDPGIGRNFSADGIDNHFRLRSDMVSEIIAQAEAADSLELYKAALEAVLERAVCVPVYQRKIYYIYSGALNQRTIEGSLTTHYNYADVIHKIKLSV